MGKKEKKPENSLATWDDVDKALREIGERQLALGEIEAEMNIAINEAKDKANKMGKPLKESIDKLESVVKEFVEDKKSEMETKTKQLNFGKVGFRQSTSVTVPAKKIDSIIKNLKKFGMEDCISIKESVNKEVLVKYPEKDIIKIGASRKIEDKFWLEADRERIRG